MLVQLPSNWRGRTILPETESEGDHRSLCVSLCENREVQPTKSGGQLDDKMCTSLRRWDRCLRPCSRFGQMSVTCCETSEFMFAASYRVVALWVVVRDT